MIVPTMAGQIPPDFIPLLGIPKMNCQLIAAIPCTTTIPIT